jgi:hypothetical protein
MDDDIPPIETRIYRRDDLSNAVVESQAELDYGHQEVLDALDLTSHDLMWMPTVRGALKDYQAKNISRAKLISVILAAIGLQRDPHRILVPSNSNENDEGYDA